MQRIKYTYYSKDYLSAEIFDIYARKVEILIQGNPSTYAVHITRYTKNSIDKREKFEQKSLQNAKRKVRKILKEEFEVNLGDEVRSKLCI